MSLLAILNMKSTLKTIPTTSNPRKFVITIDSTDYSALIPVGADPDGYIRAYERGKRLELQAAEVKETEVSTKAELAELSKGDVLFETTVESVEKVEKSKE